MIVYPAFDRCQYPQKSTLGLFFGDKRDDRAELLAVRHAAMVVTPRGLGSVAREVNGGDMVVTADFGPPHAAEKFLGAVRASAAFAVGLLMVDALHREGFLKSVPGVGLMAISSVPRATRDPGQTAPSWQTVQPACRSAQNPP